MKGSSFDTAYKNLNAKQKEAVDTIEGPVMVIAGPGTGKTTVLTLRIANILRKTDTPAHGILAITYTDAGVRAMRVKLREIIGNRAHDVRIHTYHSFAASVIAEYPSHFLHLEGLKPLTEIEQESLIRTIIEDPVFSDIRPVGKPDAYVSGIIRAIDDAKREALTPDMVRVYARDEINRIKADESSLSTRGASKGALNAEAMDRIEKCGKTILFAGVYERYEQLKREKRRLDFNDLIIELLVALRNDELLLRLIQEKFLYLLVDEHQDTNDAQNFIIGLLAEFFETPNIFIVGDEKQAIYRFQGASVANFLLLQKRWPAMKVISLDTNYRSHQGILDAGFSMIENNYDGDEHRDLRVRLKAGKTETVRPVEIVSGENVYAVEKYFLDKLREIMEQEPHSSVAIITRRNRDLERVIALLEAEHIPVSSQRSVDIFRHPVGAAFFELLEYLCDESRVDSLAKTISAGMWGLSFEDLTFLVRALRAGKTGDVSNKLQSLSRMRRKMLTDAPYGFVINAAEESGFIDLVGRDPSYVHVWRGITALAETLTRDGAIREPRELMLAMLAYRESAESKSVKVSVGAPDFPIQAMTAHSSKGLEFDYVFMPYAVEESWVGKPKGSSFVLPQKLSSEHDIRDLRRLFYVALTRARKHAVILFGLEESDGRGLTPLRFIAELNPESVKSISLPRIDVQLSDRASKKETESKSRPHASPFVTLAKDALLSSGLSVTALNHFLECPNAFLYQSILKLPQAPSTAAEKGSAMHEALSRVWHLKDRNAGAIEKTLDEGIREFLRDSFLNSMEKEAVRNDLTVDIPAVAAALEGHFAVGSAAVYTEHWVQADFDGVYAKKSVRIPIHGKLDAIVDTGSEVLVYDYKTRQAMSLNAIKGLTKSVRGAPGAYFRQLVFYKLLLSDEPRWRGKRITPSLVFVSPDDKGRCPTVTLPITDTDMAKVKQEIQLIIDSVWSGAIAHAQCGNRDCPWCRLKEVWRRS